MGSRCRFGQLAKSSGSSCPPFQHPDILSTDGILLGEIFEHSNKITPRKCASTSRDNFVCTSNVDGTSDLLFGVATREDEAFQVRLSNILSVDRQGWTSNTALNHSNCRPEDLHNADLMRSSRLQALDFGEEPAPPLYGDPFDEATKYCKNRKAFVTNSGLLGIGPRTLQKGDVVAVSKLSQWPMVLRHANPPATVTRSGEDAYYTMVGAAYVEEIRNGDLILENAAQDGGMRTIHLV